MSMNLYCDEIELWQTPTWVSELAVYDCNGEERDVEETIYIYASWVASTLNGRWEDAEEAAEARLRVKEHVEAVKNANIYKFDIL